MGFEYERFLTLINNIELQAENCFLKDSFVKSIKFTS